jgi:hypothetical protein
MPTLLTCSLLYKLDNKYSELLTDFDQAEYSIVNFAQEKTMKMYEKQVVPSLIELRVMLIRIYFFVIENQKDNGRT